MEQLRIRLQSPLAKVFLNDRAFEPPYLRGSGLRGETLAFQAVVTRGQWGTADYAWSVQTPFPGSVRVFEVKQVPCGLAAYPQEDQHDGDYLSLSPGLFPDLLDPLPPGAPLTVSGFRNTVLWLEWEVPPNCPAGEFPITLAVEGGGDRAEAVFTARVLPFDLPAQELLFTQWFHCDCLMDWYRVPAWSEDHWRIVGNYLKEAARSGMNTVLTPVLTPALDTEIGRERPCVQLLDVEKTGNTYRFDFSRLRHFVELAQSVGITHFELSHLYTQWGAKAAPNIYAVEGGGRRRIFGWDTPADSPAYVGFLGQLLPALTEFFRGLGLFGNIFFHISDEPGKDDLLTYQGHAALVSSLTGGAPVMDALSDPEFYDRGLIRRPVAATDHIGPFLERDVPGLWAYNCCGQNREVGNRFLAMPSYRNRILGWQLYKHRIAGFLHWGYNFWYSQNARHQIDPFRVTDADGAFPGGDPFSVYPGPDGKPLPSLRLKVFQQGLQDMRALTLLERLKGPRAVYSAVPELRDMTFSQYPRSAKWLLEAREGVNRGLL